MGILFSYSKSNAEFEDFYKYVVSKIKDETCINYTFRYHQYGYYAENNAN